MKALPFVAIAAAIAASSPALAEPFNGTYIGASVAYDNYEVQASDVFTAGDDFDGISANGVAGSIFAGYDLPLGTSAFAGIELGAELSDAKATYNDTVDVLTVKAKESWLATVRVGTMLNDSTGLYARAGYVNTRFSASFNGVSDSDNQGAFLYGAGVETRVGGNASLRIEYSIRDYGDAGLGNGVSVKNGQVQAGLSYRF
jgi:outer membrane immunogenic protein